MPLRSGSDMPSLTGATEWLNGEPDHAAVAHGPALVHFWAISCHICHDNMPTVRQWKARYEPQGLRFVAIHMPRQEADLDVSKVAAIAAEMNVDEPLGIDNTHAVAEAFENEFVPAYFLFDSDGKLKGRAAGENGLKMLQVSLYKLFPEQA
jgi:thiol-disulfide isomerase/thioredoxin